MVDWTCTRCGDCCRIPASIAMTAEERARLEAARPDVATCWSVTADGFQSLQAGPCPYYDGGCTVYAVRPYNCRRYVSLKGYRGSDRDARRFQVLAQRRAQPWANRHGWTPEASHA